MDRNKKKTAKLHDVEVSHISLVDRPANMTPFKFVKRNESASKGENTMQMSLKNMFGKQAATVVSVFAKSAAAAEVLGAMLIEGDLTDVKSDGSVHVIRSADAPADVKETVVHMGYDLGVAYGVTGMEDLQKRFALFELDSENFDDALKQEGFVPGIMLGLDALHTTIRNVAFSDATEDAAAFKTGVAKAVADFGAYVDDMITSLPVAAFKFEKALVALSPNELGIRSPSEDAFNTDVYDALFKPADVAETPTPEATPAAEATPATVADETPPNKDADAAEAPVAAGAPDETSQGSEDASEASEVATDTSASAEAAAEPVTEEGAPSPAPEVEAAPAPANLEELPLDAAPKTSKEDTFAEAMEALTKTLSGQITGIAEAVSKVSDRLDKSDAKVEALTKDVGGSVAGIPDEDVANNVVSIQKEEPSGDIPLMDTAYSSAKRG